MVRISTWVDRAATERTHRERRLPHYMVTRAGIAECCWLGLRRLAIRPVTGVRRPRRRRLLHDHEARPAKVLDQALGSDARHRLIGGMDAFAPRKAQRESDRLLDVIEVGGGQGLVVGAWPSLARGQERIKNSAQLRTAARHVRGSRCGGSRAKQLREPLRLPRFQHQCGASPYKSHVFCHEMPTAPTRRLDRLSKRLPWLVRRYRSWFHPHTDVFPFGRFAPAGAVQS